MSTGIKMLLILSAALLPLGLIAAFASIESAKSNRLSHEAEVHLLAADSARRITSAIENVAAALRDGASRSGSVVAGGGDCTKLLDAIVASHSYHVDLGLFRASGRRICTTDGLTRSRVTAPAAGIGTEVRAIDGPDMLRFTLGGLPGGIIAEGELPNATLSALANVPTATRDYGILLRQGDAVLTLVRQPSSRSALGQTLSAQAPVADGQLSLEFMSPSAPLRAIEVLTIGLPIAMWLAAALIGWLVVDRLMVRPLRHLQLAIDRYAAVGGSLDLPALTTPSAEIRALGDAFRNVTHALSAHEAELENGLARQTRLTREVHHRVKNNLQVVSSLINLHARGVENPDVRTAYASIQRRVDALAVVHRNHYAELEENRGVGLRPLIGELASNLRATAPQEAAGLAITLDLIPAFVSQDVAVPVAFMVTELVELAMNCDHHGGVGIALRATDRADKAELLITAPGLAREICMRHPAADRAFRILEGLSRQLRSPLGRDEQVGRYSILITVVPHDEAVA